MGLDPDVMIQEVSGLSQRKLMQPGGAGHRFLWPVAVSATVTNLLRQATRNRDAPLLLFFEYTLSVRLLVPEGLCRKKRLAPMSACLPAGY